jgi:hypothetical protein
VDSNNRVALVRLSADNDSGSEIDISAEQVKINDIIFTESVMGGEGRIASDPYTPGSAGWKIDGDGSAEFNDVTVRGEVIANTGTLGTLNVDGTLTIDVGGVITNSDNSYFITVDGLVLESIDDPIAPTTGSSLSIIRTSTTLSIGSFAGRHDTFTGDEWVEISAEDFFSI